MPITIQDRIEVVDLPRDPMGTLSPIRSTLVKVRNSARLSGSKRALLKETLAFVLSTLEDEGVEKAPEEPVKAQAPTPAPKARSKSKRRATAKVDPATV